MSDRQGKGRRKSGFLPGLMFISSGFLAGFYGIDYAIHNFETNEPSSRQSSLSLDNLITASIGDTNFDGVRRSVLGIFSGTGGVSTGTGGLDQLAAGEERAAPQASTIAVNRSVKEDRTGTETHLPEAGQLLAPADAPLRKNAHGVAPANVVVHNKAKPAALAPQNVAPNSVPANTVAPAKPPAAHDYMAPSRAVAVQPPHADAADVALFAADMPLPARLSAPQAEASAPPTYFSPLIPRTFANGRTFGGLGEEEFQRRERRCMVTAVYFEARSEPDEGQIAVGQVIMNRVKSPDYPDTICGVVYQGSDRRTGCQFSFTCDGKPDRPESQAEWDRSIRLANMVLEGKAWLPRIGNSTHYHANYVAPRWRREMARINKVGRHIFYKSPEVSITAPFQRVGDEKRS